MSPPSPLTSFFRRTSRPSLLWSISGLAYESATSENEEEEEPKKQLHSMSPSLTGQILKILEFFRRVGVKELVCTKRFSTLVLSLSPFHVEQILANFKTDADSAFLLFQWLRDNHAVRLSRFSYLLVAHALAGKGRRRDMLSILHSLVAQEGVGSSSVLCELLWMEFRGWEGNDLVFDMLASVYANSKMVDDGLFMFFRMKDLNFLPSTLTYNSLLYNLRDRGMVKDIYEDMFSNGVTPDDHTHAILIDSYCKQKKLHEATMFFHNIRDKGCRPCLVILNSLMSGLCNMGFVCYAKSIICLMLHHGFLPDIFSYNTLIHGLCLMGSVSEAVDLMVDMERTRIQPDLITYNSLINGYSLLTMIESAEKLIQVMFEKGIPPNHVTYTSLISGYCRKGDFKSGLRIRKEMIHRGIQLNNVTYGTLLNGLCQKGLMHDADLLFTEMRTLGVEPDLISYCTLINGYSRQRNLQMVNNFHDEMRKKGIVPNAFAYGAILSVLCRCGQMYEARSFFDDLLKNGLITDVFLYNIMIDGYVKYGDTIQAIIIYVRLVKAGFSPTIVTINSLIFGFCRSGRPSVGMDLLKTSVFLGLVPNEISYTTLLDGYCASGNKNMMITLFEQMIQRSIQPNVITYTVMAKRLCEPGNMGPLEFLGMMHEDGITLDLVVYNVLIKSFCDQLDISSAFDLYDKMHYYGILPTVATYYVIIKSLCLKGETTLVERILDFCIKQHIPLNKGLFHLIARAYCTRGNADKTLSLFITMKKIGFKLSISDYSVAINRLCKQQFTYSAKLIFKAMLEEGISPDLEIYHVLIDSFECKGDTDSMDALHAKMVRVGLTRF